MGFNINSVTISGNLTRDPEIKGLPTGQTLAQFSVAYNESRKQQDGSYQDVPHFFDITMWGALGESIARQVSKGDPIVFHGRLQQRRWETDDGQKRSAVGIVAYDAVPGKRKERQDGGGGFGAPPGGWGPPAGGAPAAGPPTGGPPPGGPPPGAPAQQPQQGAPPQQGQPAAPAQGQQQAWPGPPPAARADDDIPF